jgi:peroxiredoxin
MFYDNISRYFAHNARLFFTAAKVERICNPPWARYNPFMALTPSTMLPLGTPAPDFRLPDTDGKVVALGDFASAPALAVLFICNHCPYVKHIQAGLARFGRDYLARGAAIVAISSNDVQDYPADSPAKMAQEAKSAGYTFPYLYDESQAVAKSYRAACTPDIFLFDAARKLAYRGQFDDSRPGNGLPVTGKDLRAAMDAVLGGKQAPERQVPSVGCNIKWKSGNVPAY